MNRYPPEMGNDHEVLKMSALSVERSVRSQADHIAAYKQSLLAALASKGADVLWKAVDSTADIPYENVVKGESITGVDNALGNLSFGASFSSWFNLHSQYFGGTASIVGVSNLETAIDFYRWRVSKYLNDFFRDSFRRDIPLGSVFPDTETVLGTATVNGGGASITFTAGTALDTTKASSKGGILGVKVGSALTANIVLNDLKLRYDANNVYTLSSFTVNNSTYDPGDFIPLISTTLDGSSVANTGVVPVTSTNGFFVGQHVLVSESEIDWNANYTPMATLVQEVGQIISIDPGNSITLGKINQTGTPVAGMRNAFVSGDFVYPMFTSVLVNSSTGTGTATESVTFHFLPDRVLDIAYTP